MPLYYEVFVRLVAPYHAVLVHFPIAIWTTVPLIVFFRAVSDSTLARAGDRILVPILLLSIVSGIAAYVSGFVIFPLEAAGASPLIRNHIVTASWSLAFWTAFLVTRWINGETVWQGVKRWVMLGVAFLGTIQIVITGMLGGHIAGNPTTMAQVLQWLGWDVYHTFFVPNVMLLLIAGGVIALPILGWWGSRQSG
jgi:hypothetical protein